MKPKTNYSVDKNKLSKIDFCETPYYALWPLYDYISKSNIIWESASGNGNISRELISNGFNIVESDIQNGVNFFEYEPDYYDIQITNPPYGIKYDWLERSYKLGKPFALLLPIETLGSGKAQFMFNKYGIQIIVFNRRIDFKMPDKKWDGAGAQFPTAWFTYKLNLPKEINYYNLIKPNKLTIKEYYLV